uniref:Abhydrolase domain containing 15 n=1 Tax=Oryzias sinensis TaxID=183150 RepID=A0A8C7YI56_9TELE
MVCSFTAVLFSNASNFRLFCLILFFCYLKLNFKLTFSQMISPKKFSVLLSYLGECGSGSHLTAAAAISPVLLGQLWFETLMPPIYRWGALFHRKQQLKALFCTSGLAPSLVAVPVLCICSRDDPILPPASTLPLPLFLSNPYFLLVLTDRGGHCGFTLERQAEADEGRTRTEEEDEKRWNDFVDTKKQQDHEILKLLYYR